MPRFRVLRHDSPRGLHYDLLLETATLLMTFALDREPTPGTTGRAQQLPDHRRQYLEYEGPISGDRGSVAEWDSGSYLIMRRNEQMMDISVDGRMLKGRIVLRLVDASSQEWEFQVM